MVLVAIFFKMLLYGGYIQWGNFGFPLSANLLNSLKSFTWNGFSYNGIPVVSPWISFFGNLNNLSIILFGGLLDINVAIKIYIIFTFFFMTYSFYLFSASISNHKLSRIIATIFIITNPVSLELIGQGDPFQFFVWGLYFLSLLLLFRSSREMGQMRNVFLLLSAVLLSLTVSVPQIFYLGTALYIFFIIYFYSISLGHINLKSLISSIKVTLVIIPTLFLLSMPLILTSLFGVYNISPDSTLVNPLSNFVFYSANFPNMLFMNSIPSFPIANLLGSLNSYYIIITWEIAIYFFVLCLLISGIIFKDKKMLVFTIIALLGVLLGTGYNGPISFINIYFYTHLFGYQVLNDSYYWEWLVIIPSFAILLMQLMDKLSTNTIYFSNILIEWKVTIIRINQLITKHMNITIPANYFKRMRISYKLFALISLSILIILPMAGQGFYGQGNTGIHKDNLPNDYNNLVKKLDNFVGNTSVGVAYFTPDNYVYFGNNTNCESQPLLLDPELRSPSIPSYLSPPVISSYFSCYIYTQFYLNKTPYIAQLFSLLGVKYFVTLNGVISASSMKVADNLNPNDLMKYQKDIKLIYYNENYSVYESTLNVGAAQSVSDFSLYSNSYADLMYSASLGVNISKEAPIFTSDLNSYNFNFFLNNTNNLILCSKNSLTTLAIDKFTNSNTSINPFIDINNYLDNPSQGWISSSELVTENLNYIISDPSQFIISSSTTSNSYSFKVNANGNYNLWAEVLLNSFNSKIGFQINGKNYCVDQNVTNITTGTMQWVELPFVTNNIHNTLSISSLRGLNGVQRIVIIKKGMVKTEEKIITNILNSKDIPIIYLSNSGLVQYINTGIFPVKINLVNKESKSTGEYEQPITLQSKFYREKVNNNFSNVQWQYSNGTIIQSWMEGFNNTSATWWIKINGIPANNSLTIFVVFYPLNKNVLNNESTGESPILNLKYNNGRDIFEYYNSTGLIGNTKKDNGMYYKTNVGFYFYTKFYNQTNKSGNQAFVGWSFDTGIDAPMFVGCSNKSYSQPYYFINESEYLPYHIKNENYYLLGTSLYGKEAQWYVNNSIIAEVNSSKFVKCSEAYVRPTGVNISVKYSFMAALPTNNRFPLLSFTNVNLSNKFISLMKKDQILGNQKIYSVINNPNGYEIKNINSSFTIVRIDYYSGMLELTKGINIVPIMNGLNFILITHNRNENALFVSADYKVLIYGLIVYGITIIAIITYSLIVFRKEKRRHLSY